MGLDRRRLSLSEAIKIRDALVAIRRGAWRFGGPYTTDSALGCHLKTSAIHPESSTLLRGP